MGAETMRPHDVIRIKRDGGELSSEAIAEFVGGYVRGSVSEGQAAALLMAVHHRGMTDRETAALTEAIIRSGATLDLAAIPGPKVDKHSTGGVGDKTSLIVVPLVASAGVRVAKLSGRALGHTGGTLDKLEAIPGLRVERSADELIRQVSEIGCAIVSQSADLVPADKRLYALRDQTATVDSVPLIGASVMSKKLAVGSDAVVLDVKCGRGAFMKTPDEARALARAMVAIGRGMGRRTVAVLTRMDQPLGRAVGNALEVAEAVQTLCGGGPEDLRELSLALGARMVLAAGLAETEDAAARLLGRRLRDGSAARRFADMVAAQHGDPRTVEDTRRLPRAPIAEPVRAPASGVVTAIDAEAVGRAAIALGAGRAGPADAVDPAAGIVLERKVGDAVRRGEVIAVLHTSSRGALEEAARIVASAYRIGPEAAAASPLVLETLE